MTTLFVTSTGTELGKTHVMEILCRQLMGQGKVVRALKPVLSGFDATDLEATDPGRIISAIGQNVTEDAIAEICPWRFAAPLSPGTYRVTWAIAAADGHRMTGNYSFTVR